MPDIFNYLVLGTSTYTSDQFKAFRSLEAYNQCFSGWIKELGGCIIDGKNVVVGKVRHSQTLAAIPAHCWVTSEKNGTVLGACQPSTSSAGSSASSVVSTCQPSIYLICWFLSFICRFYTSALYIISSSFKEVIIGHSNCIRNR